MCDTWHMYIYLYLSMYVCIYIYIYIYIYICIYIMYIYVCICMYVCKNIYIYIYIYIYMNIQVSVEYVTRLELCWSSTHGKTSYENIFNSLQRTSFVFLEADPPRLISYSIDNKLPLSVHAQISFSLRGEGLRKEGPSSLAVGISLVLLSFMHAYLLTYMHIYIHTHTHTPVNDRQGLACILTYIYAYIHTYTHTHTS
jgi:hypothetical protein